MEFSTFLYSKTKIHTNMHKFFSDIFKYIYTKEKYFLIVFLVFFFNYLFYLLSYFFVYNCC